MAGKHAQPKRAKKYTRRAESPAIRYPDVDKLNRPLNTTAAVNTGIVIFVTIGILIGAVFLYQYFDSMVAAPLRDQEVVAQHMDNLKEMDLPELPALVNMGDQEIIDDLTSEGYTLYETEEIGTNPNGGFEVVRIPEDITLAEAGVLYLQGINNLTSAQAMRLLDGSWQLGVNRDDGTAMRLHYADFESGSIETAIATARDSQGIDADDVDNDGIDDSGNTYETGRMNISGTSYIWRISVIPLSEMYSVSGMPSSALYVGIRFTEN